MLPGRTWDDARDEVAELMIDTVDRVAPNFKASVIGRRALTPLDLEREFGLTGGDIFHGALGSTSCSRRARCLGTATTGRRCAGCTCAGPERIRAAA